MSEVSGAARSPGNGAGLLFMTGAARAALIDAKAIAGRSNWLPWLDREFGWSETTAQTFMQVHARLREHVESLIAPLKRG